MHVIHVTNLSKSRRGSSLVVRNVNKELYRRFKEKAVEDNESVGQALNQAMHYWLAKRKEKGRPDIKTLAKLNGLIITRIRVDWSTEIDKTLYGESD